MKKAFFTLFLLIPTICFPQNSLSENKNELKIGVEIPIAGHSNDLSLQSAVSNGFCVRYLRNLFENFSAGLVGGGLFYNQICEITMPNNTLYTYSFKNYYVHVLFQYKIINKKQFLFVINGSAGLNHLDIKSRHVSYTTGTTISTNESTLTEKGRNFNYLLGAEIAHPFTESASINCEYYYDIKNTNHIIGIGIGYRF